MSVYDISSSTGAVWSGGQMDSVSGASTYVPNSATDTSASESVLAQMRSDIQQKSQDFNSLKGALNSNDLGAASQAYATLQQDIQTASASAGGKSPFSANSPIGKDFQAIGAALKSGDLSAAKQALASFKTDIKTAGRTAHAQTLAEASGASTDANDGATPSSSSSMTLTSGAGILNTTA